jgi:putative tryptophan/tyrosine transport system substrate-binding protein
LLVVLLWAGIIPQEVFAQPPPKVWRIGVLETTALEQNGIYMDAFRHGMQEKGYREGRHYLLEYRSADGHADRFPALAAELVRLKVDLIVSRGTPATQALKAATTTIPIVTTAISDPRLVGANLARPGGNITGLVALNTELQGKRIELLREILPKLTRIAGMPNMGSSANTLSQRELERAGGLVGVKVLLLDVRKREDLVPAFARAANERVDAVSVPINTLHQTHGKTIAELALKHRLPAIFNAREMVLDGGLISFGVSYPDQYRRAASFVDRIFKGAKPGDLPMEQPTKFDMAINLKTAQALGITIPQSVMLRADEVIQ